MALSTVLLSFYPGAAVLAVLFPVYILVACDCDVNAAHGKGGQFAEPAASCVRHACCKRCSTSSFKVRRRLPTDCVLGPGGAAQLRHLPIFALALWPTQHVVQLITGSSSSNISRSRAASVAGMRAVVGFSDSAEKAGADGHGGGARAYR